MRKESKWSHAIADHYERLKNVKSSLKHDRKSGVPEVPGVGVEGVQNEGPWEETLLSCFSQIKHWTIEKFTRKKSAAIEAVHGKDFYDKLDTQAAGAICIDLSKTDISSVAITKYYARSHLCFHSWWTFALEKNEMKPHTQRAWNAQKEHITTVCLKSKFGFFSGANMVRTDWKMFYLPLIFHFSSESASIGMLSSSERRLHFRFFLTSEAQQFSSILGDNWSALCSFFPSHPQWFIFL